MHRAVAFLMVLFLSPSVFAQKNTEEQVASHINFLQRAREPFDRANSAEALGELGPAAKKATGPLCRAMLDPSGLVRRKADKALERVSPDLHPHVVTLLADGDNNNHLVAVETIRAMKEEGKPAKWILLRHLEMEMSHLRGLTRADLQIRINDFVRRLLERKAFFDPRVSADRYYLIKAFNSLLRDTDRETLRQVGQLQNAAVLVILANMTALAELDGENTEVMKALCQIYASNEAKNCPALQDCALVALSEVARDHPRTRRRLLPIFTAVLKGGDACSRRMCLSLLPNFGRDAKKALPLLSTLKRADPDSLVREEAAKAVAEIEVQ